MTTPKKDDYPLSRATGTVSVTLTTLNMCGAEKDGRVYYPMEQAVCHTPYSPPYYRNVLEDAIRSHPDYWDETRVVREGDRFFLTASGAKALLVAAKSPTWRVNLYMALDSIA